MLISGGSFPWLNTAFRAAAAQAPPTAQPTLSLLDERAAMELLLPQLARVRQRTGRLTAGLLESVTGVGRPIAAALTLNLFPNVVLTAVFERTENVNPGRVWIGRLEGEPLSLVTLTVVNGALAGTVSYPAALYEISGDIDGTAIVSEVDSTLLPPGAEPLRRPGSSAVYDPEAEAQAVAAQPAAAVTEITVAIFHTARARSEAGGASRIQARISNQVATANTVYTNSGINQRIRLVHSALISYRESGDAEVDLVRLTTPGDGHLDSVHATRNSRRADLVALIVGGSSYTYGACGIAYIFTPPLIAAAMAPYGFNWTALECLSTFTFEHELGHNMGAHHDRYVTGGQHGAFSYSHGYVDVSGRFRTVMAYSDQCSDRGVVCNPIPFFSNPAKTRGGRVVGRPTANNARTLNNTAPIVAAFR